MKSTIVLKGITWNHSRGYCPMIATGQRFSETHPNVTIEWEKRTLQEFADQHIDKLSRQYDLLVIDHPWAGYAKETGVIIPLNHHLPAEFLADQAMNSVGKSYESYQFNGDQFALPIDAATPVAASRPDLLEKKEISLPGTFDDLLKLAEQGVVTMPGIPIDTLMNFYMFCGALGEEPFQTEDYVVSEKTGMKALDLLRELAVRLNPEFFNWNPIKVYEAMTSRNDLVYCPWAYGYSNYSRKGYARKKLHFHNLIRLDQANEFRSTLGGTGLAISVHCSHIDVAIEYGMYVASGEIQSSLFFDNGGQPGHRKAWEDDHTNFQSMNFFRNTLKTLDQAFLRPRYNGYLQFQDNAGIPIRRYLMEGGSRTDILAEINRLYQESTNNI